MKKAVLILAVGDIRAKFSFLRMSHIGPSLIPLHTKPLAAHCIEFYADHLPDATLYLAVNESEKDLVNTELAHYEDNVKVLGIGPTDGVTETLSHCLRQVDACDQIIVQLVTTIPTICPDVNEVLVDDRKSFNKQWSTLSVVNNGIKDFGFKNDDHPVEGYAFSGTFCCTFPSLTSVMEDGVERPDDLLLVVRALHRKNKMKPVLCEWIDCGHEANYYKARLSKLQSRDFNYVKLIRKGVLVKSSSNEEKIREEVQYLQSVPEDLQPFFPRVFGEAVVEGRPAYRMEYYGYPAVSELQLYWELPEQLWERFYGTVAETLKGFRSVHDTLDPKDHHDMYIGKLERRTNAYRERFEKEEAARIFEKEWRINGTLCQPLEKLLPDLEKEMKVILDESESCIMHGDFCFGNMLYDISSDIIRLIDPRGKYGNRVTIYGDQYYDLAKLCHSSIGHYDYLVNHLFHMQMNKDTCDIRFNLRKNNGLHQSLTSQLLNDLGANERKMNILMALLFLSMTPLHDESRSRSLAMYMHGLYLLNTHIK
ncbi:MAG: aminoglycoside phosphotransferase family protein [Flavobacteriales bacterium]|nr:aminoglycoside phosphotransferase family protein [Flavobacteriales bacterium]